MHANGSGDRPQVGAAAGRAGDGPPLSVLATATTATASSLPPSPPSSSSAAVQPRAIDSGSPNDPPRSNATRHAGERSYEENNSNFLDYPAAPSDRQNAGDAAAAATQIGATLDGTDEEDAPVPPAQISADSERIGAAVDELKKTPPNVEDVPMHPSQIATNFDDVNKAMEVLPLVEKLQQAQDPPTPAVAQAPSPPPTDQDRTPSNPRGQQQLPLRPPPQSLMPSPDEDAGPPVPALPLDPPLPMLEATLVEGQSEIYDAIQVAEQTRFERNKKIIIGAGMGLLIGTAVTAGVLVSSNNGISDISTNKSEGVVLSTARPSESSLPSESSSPSEIPSLQSTTRPSESSPPSNVPSLRPTLRPSQTVAPSTSLRPTLSLRPSRTSSLRPSSMPTATPPVYCGEINLLTDRYPKETSWNLVRFDTIGGTNTEIVLEGSPEDEGYYRYEACLESGDYVFAILDSYGDGIASPGYYSVMFDGVVVAQGREFESEERVSFSIPPLSPQPSELESRPPSETPSFSLQPSESSFPSEMPSSSLQPSPLPSSPPSTYWSSLNWGRQGLGFNGDASSDRFGQAVAVSADASTVAIGAPGPGFGRPGYVKVYCRKKEGLSWEQRGDTLRGEANGDHFGWSLSLSQDGTTLFVGVPRHDSVGPYSGLVKVYQWDEVDLNYMQIGDTLNGAASGDEFGYSLDMLNDILAVGAPYNNANGTKSGQVTIYAWNETSSNFQQRGGTINGDAADDWFGWSVSLAENGQKLAVGAPLNDSNGSDSGQVRVFEWDEATSNYDQLGDSLLGDAAGDWFGGSVSFSRDGTTLAIGALDNSENGLWSGQVKVFAWDTAASNFEQIGQSLYGRAALDNYGFSVAISSEGKALAIGALQCCNKPGSVEVYEWDEAASEYERLGQSLGGEASGDQFGYALALAGNGRDLAIGAPFNDRNGTWSGRVEVFHLEL